MKGSQKMTLPTLMTLMDRIKAALTHDFVWKSRNDKLTRSNATFGAKMKRKARYQFVQKWQVFCVALQTRIFRAQARKAQWDIPYIMSHIIKDFMMYTYTYFQILCTGYFFLKIGNFLSIFERSIKMCVNYSFKLKLQNYSRIDCIWNIQFKV